jgi:predicted DNA-binding protein
MLYNLTKLLKVGNFMKLEKQKEKTISFRVSEEDFRYLNALSFMAGMSVSKFIRSMCDASINACKLQVSKGAIKLEDIETIRNNKL